MRISKCIFPRMIWRFTPFLLLWLFYSPVASALDYYWTVTGFEGQYSSPIEACEAKRTGATVYDSSTIELNAAGTSGDCKAPNWQNIIVTFGTARRFGDSCPNSDDVYNPVTGTCDQNCSNTEGQQLAARGPISPVITDNDGIRTIVTEPFTSACFTGCSYEIQSSFSDRLSCALTSGSTTEGFCNYRVTGTGESCPASTGVPASAGDPRDPNDPPPTDPGCPPPYVWTGDFCTTDPDDGDGPGDGGGDDGGGSGPGDGGGDDGGGSGPGDGGGDDGGGSGPGDGGGDDGGGSGPGDGGGDGEDPGCDPSTDPSCAPSSVTGEACNVQLACTGDALQCAILRQQKKQSCADEEFREITQEKTNELKSTLDSHFAGEEYQPIEATPENTYDLSNMIDTSSRFASGCPVIPDIVFSYGNAVSVPIGQIMTMLCPYLGWLGYLVIAFGMRRAAEIIATGM
jgi:hypothetical protein